MCLLGWSEYETAYHTYLTDSTFFKEVSMPSPAYYLRLGSTDICNLDKESSSVTALKKGTTELSLFTHSMSHLLHPYFPYLFPEICSSIVWYFLEFYLVSDVDAKISKNAAVRPPSTKINVVDPESIQFSISGGQSA